MRYINEQGLREIRDFLIKHHRLAAAHTFTRDMLFAWARDAEAQMGEGNPPSIEIRAHDAVSGHTECYTVSDDGISEKPDE